MSECGVRIGLRKSNAVITIDCIQYQHHPLRSIHDYLVLRLEDYIGDLYSRQDHFTEEGLFEQLQELKPPESWHLYLYLWMPTVCFESLDSYV